MAEFYAKLKEKIQRTPSVQSFRFVTEQKIVFSAGQFLCVMFDGENKNNRELNKYLSFSCAPGRDFVEVTKRLSESRFSFKLRDLKIGDEILLAGPFGSCVLKEQDKDVVFLAGGIGITPVISMIEDIVERNLPIDAALLYSNRTEDETAFKRELDQWTDAHKNIRVIYTLTEGEPRDNRAIKGRITAQLIKEKIDDIKNKSFFIFGPPQMVEAMKNLCREAGCEKEKIKTESFVGY